MRVSLALTAFAAAIRRVLGAPDYQGYLAHMRAAQPGREPMSPAEFAREALASRYDRVGSRCC